MSQEFVEADFSAKACYERITLKLISKHVGTYTRKELSPSHPTTKASPLLSQGNLWIERFRQFSKWQTGGYLAYVVV